MTAIYAGRVRRGTGPATAAVLLLVLSGCSAAGEGAADAELAALQAQQQSLTEQALGSLDGRSCAALPKRTVLQGLPAEALPCLGAGPARAPASGDGRPTVVNLWASWCEPCVREMPLLEQTAERAGEAVRFVGIDTQDEPASAAGLLDATGVSYDQYDDPDGAVRSAVRALGLPVTLVFDAQGREVTRKVGEIKGSWLDDALREAGASLDTQPLGAGS